MEVYDNLEPWCDRGFYGSGGRGGMFGGGSGGGGGSSSFGGGGSLSYGAAVNILMNSANGGTWSPSSGLYYFRDQDEAFVAGCNYNSRHNSWGNTSAKSADVALSNFKDDGYGSHIWFYGTKINSKIDFGHALARSPSGMVYEINHPKDGKVNGFWSWLSGGDKSTGYEYDMSKDGVRERF